MYQDTPFHPQNEGKVKQKLTGRDISQWCKNINSQGVTPVSIYHQWESGNWTLGPGRALWLKLNSD